MFLVPNVSSIFCAAGMLLGDLKHDYTRSYFTSFNNIDRKKFISLFNEMKDDGLNALVKEEGVAADRISFYPILDMRYLGQYHEVQMEANWDDVMKFNLENIFEAFHKEHNRQFGYSLKEEGTEMEIINVRLRVVGKTEKPKFLSGNSKNIPAEKAIKEHREIYIPELNKMKKVPIYDGDMPIFGSTIQGPCVIEKITTSILLTENYDCVVDDFGSFIVYEKEKFPKGYQLKNKKVTVNEH